MSDAETLRKVAKRAYKAREFGVAADLYRRLLETGDDQQADTLGADRLGYATALVGLNRLDEAAQQLEHAIALMPDDGRLRFKTGEVLSRLGRHRDAADQLAEAVRLEPNVADNHWRLALELRTLGRDAESRAELQRCLELDPNHTEAQILQMEQIYVATPERDGQAYEAEAPRAGVPAETGPWPMLDIGGRKPAGPLRPAERNRPGFWRGNPAGVVVEALALVALALWLRAVVM